MVSGLNAQVGRREGLRIILWLMVSVVSRGGDEAEGTQGSRLGHCTGLLVIDVAAHTTSVHAWKNHRDSSGLSGVSQGQREGRNMSRRGRKTFSCVPPQEFAVMQTRNGEMTLE